MAKQRYHETLSDIEAEIQAARKSLAPDLPPLLTKKLAHKIALDYFPNHFKACEEDLLQLIHDMEMDEPTKQRAIDEILLKNAHDRSAT